MGLETVAIVGTIAGTALSAYSAMEQGAAQQKAANYQAQVAVNNSVIAKANAEQVRQDASAAQAAGAQKANLEAIKTRETLARQKVASAASGLDVNSGSPVDIRGSTAAMGMLSDLNIRDETNRRAAGLFQRAQGLEMGADQSMAEANAQVRAGADARAAGNLKAIGTLVAGGAQGASMYSNFLKTGVVMPKVPSIG